MIRDFFRLRKARNKKKLSAKRILRGNAGAPDAAKRHRA